MRWATIEPCAAVSSVLVVMSSAADRLDRASCSGIAQHLEPTAETVIRGVATGYMLPRSANALC
jgi:hypothetical protein